jgi:thiol-disulfide isomerase/thioredoxin
MDIYRGQPQAGQWTVVDIWGTWCSPCIEELPSWQEFHAKQYEKVNFVALSVGSKDAADFLAKNSYTFPAMDLMNDEVAALGLSFFPSTFLLSPEGKALLLPMGGNKIGSIEVLAGGF